MTQPARVLVVMGVSGVGKTTVASALAAAFGWDFEEGDTLHPASNVEKMSAGHPLTDADREPWLDRVRAWIDAQLDAGRSGIVTCSALKRRYRDRLAGGRQDVVFLYLEAGRDTLETRLRTRTGHFMPPQLLDSQLDALEPPAPDERAITIAAADPLADQVRRVAEALRHWK